MTSSSPVPVFKAHAEECSICNLSYRVKRKELFTLVAVDSLDLPAPTPVLSLKDICSRIEQFPALKMLTSTTDKVCEAC